MHIFLIHESCAKVLGKSNNTQIVSDYYFP
jgi:hypothetical protein